jgi:hypothetical protein
MYGKPYWTDGFLGRDARATSHGTSLLSTDRGGKGTPPGVLTCSVYVMDSEMVVYTKHRALRIEK